MTYYSSLGNETGISPGKFYFLNLHWFIILYLNMILECDINFKGHTLFGNKCKSFCNLFDIYIQIKLTVLLNIIQFSRSHVGTDNMGFLLTHWYATVSELTECWMSVNDALTVWSCGQDLDRFKLRMALIGLVFIYKTVNGSKQRNTSNIATHSQLDCNCAITTHGQ
jgi:hypothetical protein